MVTAREVELLQSQDCQEREANSWYILPSKCTHQSKNYPSGVWRDSAVSARPFSPGVTYTQIPRRILGSNYYLNYYLLPKLCSWKITLAISLHLRHQRHLISLPERPTISTHSTSASISCPKPKCPNLPEHRSWNLQGLLWGWASSTHRSYSSQRSSLPWCWPWSYGRGHHCGMAVLNCNICSKSHQRFSHCSRGQELFVSPTSAN